MKMSDYIRSASTEDLLKLNRQVVDEIKLRRRQEAIRIKGEIEVGSLGTLHNVRPQYMIGATVEITEIKQTKAVCNIVEGRSFRGRYRTGITLPLNCITPIHAPSDLSELEG